MVKLSVLAYSGLIMYIFFHARIVLADPIYVTAEKKEQTRGNGSARVDYISVEMMNNSTQAKEIFRRLPGVQINENGGPGGRAGLFVRGGESSYGLVVLDGVKLNDPSEVSRGFDWGAFPVALFESAEVLKGAHGALYGSEALSGVIKLNTYRYRDGFKISTGIGSYGHEEMTLIASTIGKNYQIQFSGHAITLDGISAFSSERGGNEKDSYISQSLYGKGEIQIESDHFVKMSFFQNQSKSEYDHYNSDKVDDDLSVQAKSFQTIEGEKEWSYSVITRYHFSRYEVEREINTQKFSGENDKISGSFTKNLDSSEMVFGMETEQEEASFALFNEYKRKIYSSYTMYRQRWGLLNVEIGGRLDKRDSEKIIGTYRASSNLSLKNNYFARGGIFTGHRTPSLYQLYNQSFGNQNLESIDSTQYEIGLGREKGDFYFALDYFKVKYSNQINYVGNFPLGRFENAGETQGHGFEYSIEDSNGFISWGISATWLDIYLTNTRERLSNRSKWQYSAWLSGRVRERWKWEIEGEYQGTRQDFDGSRLSSNTLFHLATSYVLNGIDLTLSVRNLLDLNYEVQRNYGTYGRTFLAKFNWEI